MTLIHKSTRNFTFKTVRDSILLLFFSLVLNFFAFPGFVFSDGIGFLSFFSLLPVMFFIRKSGFSLVVPGAFIYGVLNSVLVFSWLGGFHGIAPWVAGFVQGVQYLIVFTLGKIIFINFKKFFWILFPCLMVVFEYLKLQGFLGFPYGITGYSLFKYTFLIQSASIAGVWILSFLCFFFSGSLYHGAEVYAGTGKITAAMKVFLPFFALLFLMFFYGIFRVHNAEIPSGKKYDFEIALIQHNTDPWAQGINSYHEDFRVLRDLTEDALTLNPETNLVVWPETAFVPRILYHYRYRPVRASYELVKELLDFIQGQEAAFLIGNDHWEPKEGTLEGADYNSALLFIPGKNVIPPDPVIYSKQKLVPFTEYFPYKRFFPWVYNLLESMDTHFWEPGLDSVVMETQNIRFGVLICYEDGFGNFSGEYGKAGCDFLVNMTNDSWADSTVAQHQHLAMSVLRAVETGLPLFRCAASGVSGVIDGTGVLQEVLPEFKKGHMNISLKNIKRAEKYSFYTRAGDFLPVFFILLLAVTFVLKAGFYIRKSCDKNH